MPLTYATPLLAGLWVDGTISATVHADEHNTIAIALGEISDAYDNELYRVGGPNHVALVDGGTGATTAAGARTNLGLGSMATQAASAVTITGGSIVGIIDLAIAEGGTGASTASGARTNLGLGAAATYGISNDTTLAADSTANLVTEHAAKTYMDGKSTLAVSDPTKIGVTTLGNLTVLDVSALLTTGSSDYSSTAFTLHDAVNTNRLAAFDLSGFATAGTNTYALPDASGTVVLERVQQTIGNKTIDGTLSGAVRVLGLYLGDASPTVTAPTLTTTRAPDLWSGGIYNLDFATAAMESILLDGRTGTWKQAGASGSSYAFAVSSAILKSDNDVAAQTPNGGRTFQDNITVEADTVTGVAIGNWSSFRAAPTFTRINSGTITSGTYLGTSINPTIGAGVTLSAVTLTGGVAAVAGTVTTLTTLKVNTFTGAGTVGTQYGIDIVALATATTNVGIRNLSTLRQVAAATFGADAAATWLMHLQGGNAAASGIGIDVSTTGPTAPASSASGVISVYKGATNWYLLITFNDAGTTRYRYMSLNGATATWTHATTLPV